MAKLPSDIAKQIENAVEAFEQKRSAFETDATNLQNRLLANAELKKLIHSLKWRAKEPSHLRDKLERVAAKAIKLGKPFTITADNVFDRIHDLAGVRLLHLHMRQIEQLHPLIMEVFSTEGYVVSGRPEAKTWDFEYERMFKGLQVKVARDESMYTSVHYVVKQNTKTRRLCELQVRTLAEEVWGEISHTINYPHETSSVACREQLKVLARVVSGCSRLVDSIVASYADHQLQQSPRLQVRRTTRALPRPSKSAET
jgi:ppGpp synthetase/RelA/SpoT-type nucleotidyltranferase